MSEYSRVEQVQALGWPLNGPCDGDPGTLFQWSWQRLRVQCAPHNQPSFLATFQIPEIVLPMVQLTPQEGQAYFLLCDMRHTVAAMAAALGTGPRQARVVMEKLRAKGAAARMRVWKQPNRPGPAPWSYAPRRCRVIVRERAHRRRDKAIRECRGKTVIQLAAIHNLSTTRIYQILEEPSA